jgi:hypothetical protein
LEYHASRVPHRQFEVRVPADYPVVAEFVAHPFFVIARESLISYGWLSCNYAVHDT